MSNSHEKAPSSRNPVARTKNAAQSAASAKGETAKPAQKKLSLAQWIHHTIAIPQARVQLRTRGNNLHILVEGETCPESAVVLPRLVRALAKIHLERLLPKDQPQIYQIFLHGRTIDSIRPAWTEVILLNQIDRYLERLQSSTTTPQQQSHAAIVVSNQSLAQQGKPDAIARYLSETLSNLGIAVQVSAKTILLEGEKESLAPATVSRQPTASTRRLSITCESAYSPDPALIAEPIAQRLRELQLPGFQDAIVVCQVQGEAKPDWLLRVDLTPREEMLRDWARWGDVQALTQLLNLTLANQQIEISTSLKDFTLHITCTVTQAESDVAKQPVMATLTPLLETLAPQGIHAATVYGFQRSPADGSPQTEAPLWVDWLDLPASIHPALAPSTLAVAQQGDLDAITFLLSRLLNTNLDAYLATGGTRIQIRQKDDLLHIMADAPICPDQHTIGKPIARLLRPLKIPGLSGIRVYGRRSGQKRPLWSYGVDFATRDRLVPEATPEFAASDAYVGDLIAKPGALVVRSQVTPDSLQTRLLHALEQAAQQTQRFLLSSRLFTLQNDTTPLASLSLSDPQPRYQTAKLVAVWGALGLLLTLQTDWILGQMLRTANLPAPQPAQSSATPSPAATPPALPNVSFKKTPSAQDGFNSEGFTGSGSVSVIVEDVTGRSQPSSPNASSLVTERGTQLNASPLQPLAAALPKPGTPGAAPTFNSRQLDEKVKLYRDRVAISGRPDILIIGSSRALRGIDPIALEKALATQGYPDVDIFNFGINGATVQVVDLVIREILTPEELPKLILWADGARAFNSGRLDVTYNGIVASAAYKQLSQNRQTATTSNAPGVATDADPITGEPAAAPANSYQIVNQRLDQWLANFSATYNQREQLKARLQEKVAGLLPKPKSALPPQTVMTQGASPSQTGTTSLPSEGQGLLDINGFLPLSNRFNPVTYYQKYARVPGDYDGDYESFTMQGKQIDALTSLVQFTQAQQISLVFINLPLTESYLDPIRQEYETEFQQEIRSQAAQQQFIYLDLSRNWLNENDFFSDPSHLNRYGAYAVSQELANSAMIPWATVKP